MKEFYSEAGGRPIFTEDIENLQELALSMTSMFEGAGDFIICGCERYGTRMTEGFVFLNGKIRKVPESTIAQQYHDQFCIIEDNSVESARYKSGVMKDSRKCYLAQVVNPVVAEPYEHCIRVADARRLSDVLRDLTFGNSDRFDIANVNLKEGIQFDGKPFVVWESDGLVITNPKSSNIAIKLCNGAPGPDYGVMVGQYVDGKFVQTRNQINLNVIGLWCKQLWVNGNNLMFESEDLNFILGSENDGDTHSYNISVAGGGHIASICGWYDYCDTKATSRFGTWYQMLRNSQTIPGYLLPKHDVVVEVTAQDPSRLIAENRDGIQYMVRCFVKITTGGDMSIMFIGSNGYNGNVDNRVLSELGVDKISLSISLSYPIDL